GGAHHRARVPLVLLNNLWIQAPGGCDPAARIAPRDDLRAERVQEVVRDGPGVAVALDRDGHPLALLAEVLARLHDRDRAPARRGFPAAERSAERDRLSGHDAGRRK